MLFRYIPVLPPFRKTSLPKNIMLHKDPKSSIRRSPLKVQTISRAGFPMIWYLNVVKVKCKCLCKHFSWALFECCFQCFLLDGRKVASWHASPNRLALSLLDLFLMSPPYVNVTSAVSMSFTFSIRKTNDFPSQQSHNDEDDDDDDKWSLTPV